ncbi:MAG: ABC transporter ATP-binding protein [Verrucomicrobiota bacterium]|nr:ABC transporter ATP-binding protein [Verrucomicrobiota bacterium]
MTELIRIQNLNQVFPPQNSALKEINLSLPEGEMVGIVGPDGAGKTTLLRLIAGLLLPTSGQIEVLGCDTVRDVEKIRFFTSYMPQRFGLYEDLSVQENLRLYADLRGLEEAKRAKTYEKLLHFTGLAPFVKRLAGALSGGMKQKLGLACALVRNPRLLILDEPSVGVDPISRRELWSIVQSLLQEGVSVLWSTTYLDEAEKCQRILLLNEGELLFQGAPSELTRRVEGRVFCIEDTTHQKRIHLTQLEKRDDVIDALIQGNTLRVVAKDRSFKDGKPVKPRLEDAFVDLLGGLKKGESKLSQAAPLSNGDGEAVVAKDLVKRFGSFTAVNKISFSVKKGEVFGFLGPNGAGKSTTFKMLCGLLKPTEGKASVSGYDLQKAPGVARAKIGYMAQKFSLYGNLTVRQNLEFFAGIYPNNEGAAETLSLFDLEEQASLFTDSLPIGFKQRLALATAVLHWPDLLFLDEPTSGMDPVSRRQFWSQMNSLTAKGKTIIVSTHFMDEAENCDRIALIYRGLIIHLDTPDRLKELAKSEKNPDPTLEDAFIQLIEEFDAAHP